jgi:hypothetical protein
MDLVLILNLLNNQLFAFAPAALATCLALTVFFMIRVFSHPIKFRCFTPTLEGGRGVRE